MPLFDNPSPSLPEQIDAAFDAQMAEVAENAALIEALEAEEAKLAHIEDARRLVPYFQTGSAGDPEFQSIAGFIKRLGAESPEALDRIMSSLIRLSGTDRHNPDPARVASFVADHGDRLVISG